MPSHMSYHMLNWLTLHNQIGEKNKSARLKEVWVGYESGKTPETTNLIELVLDFHVTRWNQLIHTTCIYMTWQYIYIRKKNKAIFIYMTSLTLSNKDVNIFCNSAACMLYAWFIQHLYTIWQKDAAMHSCIHITW